MTISYGRLVAMGLLVGFGIYIASAVSHQPDVWSLVLAAALVGALLFLAMIDRGWIRLDGQIFGSLLHLRCQAHPSIYGYCGFEQDFLSEFAKYRQEDEVIYLVALRHPSGRIYAARRPARHPHVIRLMVEHGDAGLRNTKDQGFVTSWGRYVDRKEACVIARCNEQLIRKDGPQDTLFSEDLWAGPLLSQRELQEKANQLIDEAFNSNQVIAIESVASDAPGAPESGLIARVSDSPALARWKEQQRSQAEQS